jgi:predicted DNA binding CopG/RHH family protein
MNKNFPLDAEERELAESYDRDEWRPLKGGTQALREYQEYALASLEEEGIVSILLPRQDLGALRQKAVEAGTSYQNLIANILHLYLTGQLVEKPRRT